MAGKRKGKGDGGESSPEFKAFEDLAKKVLSVPKTEIDKREAEALRERKAKRKVD
jgi:hypothetical protein